jgi:hypothetical protein
MLPTLTGETQYRLGFRKCLVLQVKKTTRLMTRDDPLPGPQYSYWCDATIEDLQALAKGKE